MHNPIMFGEQEFRSYMNMQPSSVKGIANEAVSHNKRMLYTKLYSAFKFKLPNTWNLNWFRFWLFHYGSIAVIYTNEFGWVAQPYTITELNINYNPKTIQVYSSYLKKPKIGVVGVNSEVVHIMDDYFGLDNLITRYASRLAAIDKAIEINLANCNVSLAYEAKNKKEAAEIKEAYEKASTGEPLVVINADLLDNRSLKPFFGNVSSTYIVDKLLNARRAVMNEFLTEVGIANANVEKRERLNSDEVNANNEETKAIVSVIYDNLVKSFEVINQISDLQLSVSLRYNNLDESEVDEWAE